MKRYNIIKGNVSDYFNKNKIDSSLLLQDCPQVNDTEIIYTSYDKQEAEKEFSKYYCDAIMSKTQIGYHLAIEYYELEEVEVDSDDEVVINSTIAPFAKKEYTC